MYIREQDVIWTKLNGTVVAMGIGSGKYFEIEGVGQLIWELLEQQRSISELVEAIVAEHEVDAAACERDVREFITALQAADLVQKIEC